jgi:hypothetical protein
MPGPVFESIGDFRLPIPDSGLTGNLSDLDPVRSRLLALFKAALIAELAPAWNRVSGTPLDGKAVVESAVEFEPTKEHLTQFNAEHPVLALHRSGPGVSEAHTLELDKITQPWTLHYILGPLDVAGARKLGDLCQVLVPRVIATVIRRQGHPAYESGALQFFPGTGGLQSIRLVSFEAGAARYADTTETVYACTMALEIVETCQDTPGAEGDFDSVGMDIGIGGGEGVIHGLLFADTDAPYQEP